MDSLNHRIRELVREKKAMILAHNYQSREVRKIADHMGDSLELSRRAAESDAELIVFCGVRFMAETAKILKPSAKVLLPREDAGCPMADMGDTAVLSKLKQEHPRAAVCAYVNSYAHIKAESDICCTSSNAVKIATSLEAEEIIMLPDRNLAQWVSANCSKKIIPYPGYCYVHRDFKPEDVQRARREHPDAVIISHPECDPGVLELSDKVASTSGMLRFIASSDADEFILGTEMGVAEEAAERNPEKKVYSLGKDRICKDMKKISLSDVERALREEEYEIVINPEIIRGAQRSLSLMLERSR